jgi:hypothetical protein
MHTDHTLRLFDEVTVSIGEQFRTFTKYTCTAFETRELQREADARRKKTEAHASSKATRRLKTFNLQTYKYHALGDYPAMIRRFGTCDSYSTEPVSYPPWPYVRYGAELNARAGPSKSELEHRTAKARYRRTDRKRFTKQMAQIERRQERIRRIRTRNFQVGNSNSREDDLRASSPDTHHYIGKSQNHWEHIGLFVQKNLGDPAVAVSLHHF